MSSAHGALLHRDLFHVGTISYEPESHKMQTVEKETMTKDVGSFSTFHVHLCVKISFGLDKYVEENRRGFRHEKLANTRLTTNSSFRIRNPNLVRRRVCFYDFRSDNLILRERAIHVYETYARCL